MTGVIINRVNSIFDAYVTKYPSMYHNGYEHYRKIVLSLFKVVYSDEYLNKLSPSMVTNIQNFYLHVYLYNDKVAGVTSIWEDKQLDKSLRLFIGANSVELDNDVYYLYQKQKIAEHLRLSLHELYQV
jgi:hypothetical protein